MSGTILHGKRFAEAGLLGRINVVIAAADKKVPAVAGTFIALEEDHLPRDCRG